LIGFPINFQELIDFFFSESILGINTEIRFFAIGVIPFQFIEKISDFIAWIV
jgi:hypothetical protein